MITRGQEPTDAPASPSPRATTVPSDSETQATSPNVVDVTDGGSFRWRPLRGSCPTLLRSVPVRAPRRSRYSTAHSTKPEKGRRKRQSVQARRRRLLNPQKNADRAPALRLGARSEVTSKTAKKPKEAITAREPGDASREDAFGLSEFIASIQLGTASVTAPPVTADPLPMVPSPRAAPEVTNVVDELRALKEEVLLLHGHVSGASQDVPEPHYDGYFDRTKR
ncbi:LOW QUALITY PROTEIN: hypothetical protein PHMEG_00021908 [Phytophthora megakarya]|uniref:Uncharacterized protein n=1 Tax=Phytophthora megakarya TaxID=4795 RepID=A0A225VKP8_9STRA|nr:LOW QUALITY PROTEIN: hypothetical protein PHMEG_00021908 [Phytophthora megakarya]